MLRHSSLFILSLIFVLSGLFASTAQESSTEDLEDNNQEIYGNRAESIEALVDWLRPAQNWRDYLAYWLAEENPKYSQRFEELIIRDYFRDMKGGVFLDVGCWLPRTESTTYFLEWRLKWSGIAIDAVSDYEERWKKIRPRSQFFGYAITDTDGDTVAFYVGGAVSSLDEDHVKGMLKAFGPGDERVREIKVSTITLNTLLENAGVEHIDFLSMDIEGAEPLALKGFDIQRFKPALVCIENSSDIPAINEYFTTRGYELIEKYLNVDKINRYFRPVADVDPFR